MQELLRRHGITAQLLGRGQRFTEPPAFVFIAVKAYQLDGALRDHLPHLDSGTLVSYIGNGWLVENLEKAIHTFPQIRFRVGSSTLGSTRTATGFEIRGNGKITWGPLDTTPVSAAEKVLLNQVPAFGWVEKILPVVKKKWLFNSSLNTLCGAFALRKNAEALGFQTELRQLFDEAYRFGEKRWGAWEMEPTTAWREFLALVETTRDNENSMAQDVRLGTPTEVAFLTGLADGDGGFPVLNRFTKLLRDKEQNAKRL